MNKLFSALAPAAIVLAASLGCGAANAAGSQANANVLVVAQAQTLSASQPSAGATMEHRLTRKDVYNQLVRDEKNGTIARLNSTVYFGS